MHHTTTHAAAPRAAARRPAQALAALALGYRQACAPAAPRQDIKGDGQPYRPRPTCKACLALAKRWMKD
jgi:hypothetical protein